MATALDRGAYGYRSSKRAGRPIGWDRNRMAEYAGEVRDGREISTSGGLKSRPGATRSIRDTPMSNADIGANMERTADGAWSSFFGQRPQPKPTAGILPSLQDFDPTAKRASGFWRPEESLMPQSSTDAAPEMARSFIPSPASPTPTDPRQLIAEAMDSSLQFFDRAGIPMDDPAPGRVQSGTQFASPYGTGSVRYAGDNAPIYAPGTGNIRSRRAPGQSFDLSFLAI